MAVPNDKQPYVEPLFVCVQRGDLKDLIDLLSKDPNAVNAFDDTGQTVLQYACALGQIDIVIHLLNRYDCKILQQDKLYGYTSLHVGCLYNQQRVVLEVLKKLRSDTSGVSTQDNLGWTALHHAARNGNVEICKLLVSHGGNPEITNHLGKTACHYAGEHGHLSVLQYLYDYVERNIKPKASDKGKPIQVSVPTLLHCAALNNHMNVAEWLKQMAYPPTAKLKRELDQDEHRVREEYAEDVAAGRGHSTLKGFLSAYRLTYETWIRNISNETTTLDRIKLCICGHPRAGKSAMRESLSKPYLQALLGSDVQVTLEEDVDRHTFGIEITSMQLSGKDLFSVWDFAGQVNSFITHQFFISTQSTVFTVLINLTQSPEQQRDELMWWLGFIKTRNLGQVPFFPDRTEQEEVPMPSTRRDIHRVLSIKSWMKRSSTLSKSGSQRNRSSEIYSLENESQSSESSGSQQGDDMYGSVLQPVPVVIVGSHHDQIPPGKEMEVVANAQRLVDEMREVFEEHLDVSPRLYPLNCLKAVSVEMKTLKEQLCVMRSKLLEVQPRYPEVMEQIARKVESLRVEQPKLKVFQWDAMKAMVREEVNRLVSQKQLGYICKCLTNAGVLVYIDQGALANYIFIDPAWLCKDVLGKALAPESFPVAHITRVGSSYITEDVLRARFTEHIDKKHFPVILDLLQNFDLCHRSKETGLFLFPSFITETLDPQKWKPEPDRFVAYIGRHLVCTDETDAFPPGFFSRLQVQVSGQLRQVDLFLGKGSFLVEGGSHQCLVRVNSHNTAIDIIGRTATGHSHSCIQLMDSIQTNIAHLVRTACPTVFLNFQVFSSSDLKAHKSDPHRYMMSEVIAADSSGKMVTNAVTLFPESPIDLLFCGDERLKKNCSGKNTKVAYLPEEIIEKIQELLEDGDKDWKDLARELGLGRYTQLLESRSSQSTRMLLLKWGERPKWTVESLLSVLKQLGRDDVHAFIRARMT